MCPVPGVVRYSVCGPTRASLLTGLYCQQVGHRGDRWNEPKDFNKCVLVSELLQAAGYRTMMVGKWQGRDLAVDRGFDRFFGPMCQAKKVGHVIDIMATCLDVAGQEYPTEFQGRRPVPREGRSLLPVFQGHQRAGHQADAGAYRSITSSGWDGGKRFVREAVERGNSTIWKRMAPRQSIWQQGSRNGRKTLRHGLKNGKSEWEQNDEMEPKIRIACRAGARGQRCRRRQCHSPR